MSHINGLMMELSSAVKDREWIIEETIRLNYQWLQLFSERSHLIGALIAMQIWNFDAIDMDTNPTHKLC